MMDSQEKTLDKGQVMDENKVEESKLPGFKTSFQTSFQTVNCWVTYRIEHRNSALFSTRVSK